MQNLYVIAGKVLLAYVRSAEWAANKMMGAPPIEL